MRIILFILYVLLTYDVSAENTVLSTNKEQHLRHFWRSTGFCPLAPRNNISEYLLSEDEKMNLVIIGSMPNNAIKFVRIHWLLDMIKIKSFDSKHNLIYDFTTLDSLINLLFSQELRPIFELMGNPSSYFTDFLDEKQSKNWQNLVKGIIQRYKARFGIKYVSKWRFELWNEPDLRGYNILNLTLPGYLNYVNACAQGLSEVRRQIGLEDSLKLGGPAGLFKSQEKHPLCWGLISQCSESPSCPLNFMSFHKKGDGTTNGVLNKGLELVEYIHSHFPKLRTMPIANTEADMLTGWSKSKQWRADVRYAAMVVKVIIEHYTEFVQKRGLNIEVLSNDNAFLNYHPYYFTQRTLLARFQMNNTKPSHIQFFKKPVYVAMVLLSYLGDTISTSNINIPKDDSLFHVLSTSSIKNNMFEYTVIACYSNDTSLDNNEEHREIVVRVPDYQGKYVVYILDNVRTNPYAAWKLAGSAAFPDKDVRAKMRQAEGPFRLVNPGDIKNTTVRIDLKLKTPSLVLVHICSTGNPIPGQVTNLRVYNITKNEVLVAWSDKHVRTKCIRTYEIEFKADVIENEIAAQLFTRVNTDDVIFLWYQYVATGLAATPGVYRVRAVDYWDRPGPYSRRIRFPS